MATLEDLNMQYVSAESNEEIEGGAILVCSRSWTIVQLEKWLPDFDFYMIEEVKAWLESDAHIAEDMYLKVWVD